MRRRTLATCCAALGSASLVLAGTTLPAQAIPLPLPTATATATPTVGPPGSPSGSPSAGPSASTSPSATPTSPPAPSGDGDGAEIPLVASPTRGGPGTAVTLTAPCDAENGSAVFVPADADGEGNQDILPVNDVNVENGTLTARFTIPDGSVPGDAGFVAGCGEDQHGIADFRVLATSGADPGGNSADGDAVADAMDMVSGAAVPVPGNPNFTG